jgi:hypothetical protein
VLAIPRKGNQLLGNAMAAYVNVLAMANGKDDYLEQVTQALDNLGFDLDGLEDLEPLADRRARFSVDQDLLDLAKQSELSGLVKFGTFHSSQEL